MGKHGFDKRDLKAAFDTYFESLRNFLYYKSGDMDLAEDLIQEVFLKVWEKRDEIRKETLKSLLYTMANNLLMNHFNHMKVVKSHEEEVESGERVSLATPQFELETQEFSKKLNDVLKKIPETSRDVFLMNRIDGLKYEEISSRLGIGVKAVEKRMSKALSVIRSELGRKI